MDTISRDVRVSGRAARGVGLGLLLAGILWTFGFSVLAQDFVSYANSRFGMEVAVPHADVVWLCLALVLVSWGRDLLGPGMSRAALAGTVLYASGCVAQRWTAPAAWLLPAGALLTAAGILLEGAPHRSRWAGIAIGLGLSLDALLSVGLLLPAEPLVRWIGTPEELPQRLLRLARVAAVTLPLLALALGALRDRARDATLGVPVKRERVVEWLVRGMTAGAVGMPLLLTVAAVVDTRLKYLLPVTADLVLAGTFTGCWLAWRLGRRIELLGWGLVAASMLVGMGIGGYAFDGPLPSPVGDYDAEIRTWMRAAHSGAVVLGMALVLGQQDRRWTQHVGPERDTVQE